MSRLRTAGLAGLVVVLAAGAAVGGFGVTRGLRADTGRATPTRSPARPAAYGSAGATPTGSASGSAGAVASPAAIAATLSRALSAGALGDQVRAQVVDVGSGTVLYNRDGSSAATPASTAKILTAAALLTVRAPSYRISTTVDQGAGGTVVLVGDGDPTLTGARRGTAGAYPGAARISELAAQLRAKKVTVRRIVVDDSAFTGPNVSPAWAAEDVPSEYGSAITAVMTDGGRAHPSDTVRSASPDLAAGAELAAALGRPRLPVSRGTATSGRTLARVRSAPLSVLVEQMLTDSDDVIAECLARQVALATGATPSFTGAAAAVREALGRLGVSIGRGLVDGSGLAAGDRVAPTAIVDVLRLAAGPAHPPLRTLIQGLPVAAWSGTLTDRYLSGTARAGAGVVRAKTGTLTGVSALAGFVHDRSGRLLAFAILADRTGATAPAQAALDVAVARLARCGCG